MEQANNFPYVWKNDATTPKTLTEVFQQDFPQIKSLLLEYGAVLFKSYGIDNPTKLEQAVQGFPGQQLNYAGGNSPRTNLHGQVYTSTEHPSHTFISLHNELSYASEWPSYIFFCCETPAEEGGHTVIANSRNILNDLSPEIVAAFREKGVCYIRNLHSGFGPGPSWQETFETEDRKVVEEHCRANDIEIEWHGETLRLIEKRDAIIEHSETGQEVWFNQADQFHPSTNPEEVFEALMEIYEDDPHEMPQYACFRDGSPIPDYMLEEIRNIGDKNTAYFTWEKGDLLLLDNILTAHGRSPFKGERRVLVSMLS